MPQVPQLRSTDFAYTLPDERIARFPVEPRDHSRLLHYQAGEISHHRFYNLAERLPAGSLLVFNNTRVIPARLHFPTLTGATIEVFLLSPQDPHKPLELEMLAQGTSIWTCMVGNRKKWKEGEELHRTLSDGTPISARWQDMERNEVALHWDNSQLTLSDILEQLGEVPLPPYLKREALEADRETYQTVYAKKQGAVAAPTAGLHFTQAVLDDLAQQGFPKAELTLHVSAGTFQPIKVENATDHPMHSEQIVVNRETLALLAQHEGPVIPVGTTSMRSLESLYWYGVKLLTEGPKATFHIEKLYPWTDFTQALPSRAQAYTAILEHLVQNQQEELVGETEIYIFPGYTYRVCGGIITNFHQPESTLMLLVAALVGEDWRRIYDSALEEGYRFLSYGDSSLLIP